MVPFFWVWTVFGEERWLWFALIIDTVKSNHLKVKIIKIIHDTMIPCVPFRYVMFLFTGIPFLIHH